MVPSHRPGRFATGPALFPVYRLALFKRSSTSIIRRPHATWRDGRTESGLRIGAMRYEREPGWFPLIGRVASRLGLLSFRYLVWLCLRGLPHPSSGDLMRRGGTAGVSPACVRGFSSSGRVRPDVVDVGDDRFGLGAVLQVVDVRLARRDRGPCHTLV